MPAMSKRSETSGESEPALGPLRCRQTAEEKTQGEPEEEKSKYERREGGGCIEGKWKEDSLQNRLRLGGSQKARNDQSRNTEQLKG